MSQSTGEVEVMDTLHLVIGPENSTEYGRITVDGRDHMVSLHGLSAAVWSGEGSRFEDCYVEVGRLRLEIGPGQQGARCEAPFAGKRIYVDLARSSDDSLGERVIVAIGLVPS